MASKPAPSTAFIDRAPPTARTRPTSDVALFTDDADHALVQDRVGLVYGFVGAASLAFYVVGVVFFYFARPDQLWRVHTSPVKVGHLLVALAFLGAFSLRRTAVRVSRAGLAAIDLGGGVGLMALAGLTSIGKVRGFPFELILLVTFVFWATLRAALVPSPPRWTALVTALAAVPVAGGAYVMYLREPTWSVAILPKSILVVMVVAWSVAGVAAATTIARVVYGLRREVKSATRLGQYTLETKIGEGGMGVVYRASHALLQRPTAIKLLSRDASSDTNMRRFEREVQTTSKLTHPNTVAIYDFGRTREGVFYYAMELLDGVSLQDLIEEDGPQPAGRVVHVLAQIAGALAEAHGVGLVHRDIKPANVLLCERGGIPDFVKVVDFGLVKDVTHHDAALSSTNALVGTPLYMAPECITKPDTIDARADLYAIGGVGYWLLTGEPPFAGDNLVEVCAHHLHTVPEAPSKRLGATVPPLLEALVLACLEKSPDARPASAAELARALEACRGECSWTTEDATARWRERRTRPAGERGASLGTAPAIDGTRPDA
jgi:eukaryotic-like serine/threonine-protein kinase